MQNVAGIYFTFAKLGVLPYFVLIYSGNPESRNAEHLDFRCGRTQVRIKLI